MSGRTRQVEDAFGVLLLFPQLRIYVCVFICVSA